MKHTIEAMARESRYHRCKQTDGRGYMIVELHDGDPTKATVLHANMTEATSRDHLVALRYGERQARGQA